MANEYKCDICGAPATVHITKIIDGKKVKIHLCSNCAEKASLDAFGVSSDIFPKIKELEQELIESVKSKNGGEFCPTCGTKLSEIEKGARFSCQDCYTAMQNKLFELFTQIHGATAHVGKKPRHHAVNMDVSAVPKPSESAPFDGKPCDGLDIDSLIEEAEKEMLKSESVETKAAKPSLKKPSKKTASDSVEIIRKELETAISEERYEDAAKLRDKLKTFSK